MVKYLNYALLATITGSILGVLIGEKILPYVIVRAYKIMYMSIPNIALPYNWSYAVMATVAAVACTTTATLYSCYKELTTTGSINASTFTQKGQAHFYGTNTIHLEQAKLHMEIHHAQLDSV